MLNSIIYIPLGKVLSSQKLDDISIAPSLKAGHSDTAKLNSQTKRSSLHVQYVVLQSHSTRLNIFLYLGLPD